MRRVLIFLLSLLVAAACTPDAGPARPPVQRAEPRDGWQTFRHPEQPWSLRHPPGWHLQTFDHDFGLATHEGAVLSNVRHRFSHPRIRNGSTGAFDFRRVPERAVVIEMSQTIRLHFSCTRTSATPMNLRGAERVRGEYGSPPRRWISLCLEGQPNFGLNVWFGSGASRSDRRAARKVVRSLRLHPPLDVLSCDNERATDLSLEPDYTADYLGRWKTSDGCDVRLDVVMTRTGGCYDGETADLLMGWPLGESSEAGEARIYVRDPENRLGDAQTSDAFAAQADLPAGARDTLLRDVLGAQLWLVPGDDSFVYLVYADRTEAWPLDESPVGCE